MQVVKRYFYLRKKKTCSNKVFLYLVNDLSWQQTRDKWDWPIECKGGQPQPFPHLADGFRVSYSRKAIEVEILPLTVLTNSINPLGKERQRQNYAILQTLDNIDWSFSSYFHLRSLALPGNNFSRPITRALNLWSNQIHLMSTGRDCYWLDQCLYL